MRFGEIKARVRLGTYTIPDPALVADAMIRRGLMTWAGHDPEVEEKLMRARAAADRNRNRRR
jgi:hypothetical protein